jgi:hypothetical protein
MLVRRLPNGTCISVTLTTREHFARFVRTGAYRNRAYWNPAYVGLHGPSGLPQADSVLRRIEYSWAQRHAPVRSVSWFEAEAFCRSVRGRLPWTGEWLDAVGEPAPPGSTWTPPDPNTERLVAECYQSTDPQWTWGGIVRDHTTSEWCADAYHPTMKGPAVRPDRAGRRRVVGGALESRSRHPGR